jgi:hypothetical protein
MSALWSDGIELIGSLSTGVRNLLKMVSLFPLPCQQGPRSRAHKVEDEDGLAQAQKAETDKSEYLQLCRAIAVGFVVMGFIGYLVKLIHIPM